MRPLKVIEKAREGMMPAIKDKKVLHRCPVEYYKLEVKVGRSHRYSTGCKAWKYPPCFRSVLDRRIPRLIDFDAISCLFTWFPTLFPIL